MEQEKPELKKILTPFMVWGLGVGYVISGNYFGWNLGLAQGGTLGLAVATAFIILLYLTFTFSYAELACAIPKAGGAFDYARKAFGDNIGFMVGMAQNIEFIFAPPAIAFGIGAYLNLFLPGTSIIVIAVIAYVVFTSLNIYGLKTAATFEVFVTIIALSGLVLFAVLALPHFEFANLQANALPLGTKGIFGAIPFAIWFFLGIEGVANVAEESVNPKRTILVGIGAAFVTLVILCLLTFSSAIGVAGWEAIVYDNGVTSDSPLPLAIAKITGGKTAVYSVFIVVGLFGLVASFHGLILAAGRSTFEFGRTGYAPVFFGKVHRKFQTPANALIVNMIIGIIALLTGKTGEIITIAVFGALTIYVGSMFALIKLRKSAPGMPRPFVVPFYPVFPIVALVIGMVALIALAIYNPMLALIYFGLMAVAFIAFKIFHKAENIR